jgi:hypothetical protein
MRTIRPFIAFLLLGLILVACGSGASSVGQPGEGFAGDQSTSGGGVRAAPSSAPMPAGQDNGGEAPNAVGARDDAKIVRTGSIELEVTDVARALRAARDAIIALGGYVGASNTSNAGDRPTAQITYRVPVDKWEGALDALRSLGGLTSRVVNEQTDAVEVTGQVVDLQARIRNLRASEQALQGIAAKAAKVSDVLEVEARLTDVRGQIEQLTAQLGDLSDRAAYSTLTAYFNSPVVAVEVARNEWEPATTIDEAAASLISIFQGLANAGIWLIIVWVPVLLVLGLIAGAAWWLARRLGIRRPRSGGPGVAPPPTIPGDAAVTDTWR